MQNGRRRFSFFSNGLKKAQQEVPATVINCGSDSASSLPQQDTRSWMSNKAVTNQWPATSRHPSADSSRTDVSMEVLEQRAPYEEAQRWGFDCIACGCMQATVLLGSGNPTKPSRVCPLAAACAMKVVRRLHAMDSEHDSCPVLALAPRRHGLPRR